MQYTEQRPKVPGYYWVKSEVAQRIEYFFAQEGHDGIYCTRQGGGGVDTLKVSDWIEEVTGEGVQFAGPIDKPKPMASKEFVLTILDL